MITYAVASPWLRENLISGVDAHWNQVYNLALGQASSQKPQVDIDHHLWQEFVHFIHQADQETLKELRIRVFNDSAGDWYYEAILEVESQKKEKASQTPCPRKVKKISCTNPST